MRENRLLLPLSLFSALCPVLSHTTPKATYRPLRYRFSTRRHGARPSELRTARTSPLRNPRRPFSIRGRTIVVVVTDPGTPSVLLERARPVCSSSSTRKNRFRQPAVPTLAPNRGLVDRLTVSPAFDDVTEKSTVRRRRRKRN